MTYGVKNMTRATEKMENDIAELTKAVCDCENSLLNVLIESQMGKDSEIIRRYVNQIQSELNIIKAERSTIEMILGFIVQEGEE